ncbi:MULTISPECIES: hypothetical protein [unclassified Nonomuraea]|uniref:hypothetical protein n=1 Tax=unclassified Nonomuraea TaxID=2593643 RepID=UPI0033D966A5
MTTSTALPSTADDPRQAGHDPPHAVATSNGRYYSDPANGNLLVSVTNVLDQHSKRGLAPAAASQTATWFADHLPQALRAAVDPEELAAFRTQAASVYQQDWERRAQLGIRVHRQAEAINLDAPIAPDADAEPFITSYLAWLEDFGVSIGRDISAAECTVLHRGLGYGGTSDLWVRLRFPTESSPLIGRYRPRAVPADPLPTPSGLWLVDIKTSTKHPASTVWSEYPLQLAALRNAEVALICPPECRYGAAEGHGSAHEFEVPQFVGTAILNLRRDTYGFIPLEASAAEFDAFCHLVPVARYFHGQDLRGRKPIRPPNAPPAKPARTKNRSRKESA